MDDSWLEPEPEDDFRSAPEPLAQTSSAQLARTSSAQLAQIERAERERVEAAVRATKADTAIDEAELRHALAALDSIQSFKNEKEFATAQDDGRTCARPRLLPFPGAHASSSFS